MTSETARRRLTRRNAAAIGGITAVVLLGGLALWLADDERGGATGSVLGATCDVLALATRGDARAASSAFLDRAHEPIHQLARRAADAGRRQEAARLLEAKNVIESSRAGPSATDAEQLVAATRNALRALEEPARPCPAP